MLKNNAKTAHRSLKIIAFIANGIGRQAGPRGHKTVAKLKNKRDPVLRDTPETSYEVLHSKIRFSSD
jgi:hypothetical protein